jgi:AcrR family transcriptional regulator
VVRPIGTPDEALLDAAGRVLMAEGPRGFTLAKAAETAGVSAATYVKRFGSKENLFVRLSRRWAGSLDHQLEEAADGIPSPLQRLRVAALYSYHDLDNPATASKQLAALAIDLQHDEMRALLHVGWGHVRRHLARHAAAAVEAGELQDAPPPDQLARIVMAAMEGGCLAWSVHPDGSLVERLTADLDALLSGWTTGRDTTHD